MKPTIEELEAAQNFCEMVSEIGMPKDTIIPVWPIETEMAVTHPLTVGIVATFCDILTKSLAIARGESVVVPREPTNKQRDAFYQAMRSQGYKTMDIAGINEVEIYKAMIAAAQEAAKDE